MCGPAQSDPESKLDTVALDQLVAKLNNSKSVRKKEYLLLLSDNKMRTTHSTWKKALTRALCARQISGGQNLNSKSMTTIQVRLQHLELEESYEFAFLQLSSP